MISPSETSTHIIRKTERYLDAGTKMVWNVYPDEEAVYVYLPTEIGMSVQKFTMDDTLGGGDVLPGFSLKVSDVFKTRFGFHIAKKYALVYSLKSPLPACTSHGIRLYPKYHGVSVLAVYLIPLHNVYHRHIQLFPFYNSLY